MKLATSLLLPVLVGAASAATDASVYIFQGDAWPNTSKPPTLSPEQARLVFAQRMGASQYHGLEDASERTLSYINSFGGRRESLFQDSTDQRAAELILIVEGVSSKTARPLLEAWASITPAFAISNPPSLEANERLVLDLHQQSEQLGKDCAFADALNPFDAKCWNGPSKIMHFDLGDTKNDAQINELMSAQERLVRFAKKDQMNVAVVLMPESSRLTKSRANPYGQYYSPSRTPVGLDRRQVAEEPMTGLPAESSSSSSPLTHLKQLQASKISGNSSFEPIKGVPPVCHTSLDSCITSTNNCSGHGACYRKYGNAKEGESIGACFTCGCMATNETFKYANGQRSGFMLTSWGGSACHKRDVSGPFWLIAISSVVMVGLVSWAIGLLFSIGEEKLPGVIGAGVSSKAR